LTATIFYAQNRTMKRPSRLASGRLIEAGVEYLEILAEHVKDEERMFLYGHLNKAQADELVDDLSGLGMRGILRVKAQVIIRIGPELVEGWPVREDVVGKAYALKCAKDKFQKANVDNIVMLAMADMFVHRNNKDSYIPILESLYEMRKLQYVPPRIEGDNIIVEGKSTKIRNITKDCWENELFFAFSQTSPENQILEAHALKKGWWIPSRPKICSKHVKGKNTGELYIIRNGCKIPLSTLTEQTWSDWLKYFVKGTLEHTTLLRHGEAQGWKIQYAL